MPEEVTTNTNDASINHRKNVYIEKRFPFKNSFSVGRNDLQRSEIKS